MTPFSLQSRIVIALTLSACSVSQVQPGDLPASERPDLQDAVPPLLPPLTLDATVSRADLLGDLTLEVFGEPGTTVLVFASDERGLDVAAGVKVNLADPVAVASVVLEDVNGLGVARVSAPHLIELTEREVLFIQVVSLDGKLRTEVLAETIVPFHSTCKEVADVEDDARLVCDPGAVPGQCPGIDGVFNPEALFLAATGENARLVEPLCHETEATGSCCYQMAVRYGEAAPPIDTGWDAGRPFRVAGESRQAELVRPSLAEAKAEAIAEGWASMAREEHASVAAFARFSLEMMELGAPMELVREACRAQLDEAHHAELTLALASEFSGRNLVLGAISMDGALDGRDLRSVTMDVVREGCINETVSAVIAMAARDTATHTGAKDALTVIADDEARHSELAWRFVGWAVQQDSGLREEVLAVLNDFQPTVTAAPSAFAAELAAHGVLDARATQEAALRAGQVIRQCASSLS